MITACLAEAIVRAGRMLKLHGVLLGQWALAGPYAYKALGYDVIYHRSRHFHIVMKPDYIPWNQNEMENMYEVVPPQDTKFGKDFQKYIKKTGYDFDIILWSITKTAGFENHIIQVEVGHRSIPCLDIKYVFKLQKKLLKRFPEEKIKIIADEYKSLAKSAKERGDKELYQKAKKLAHYYIHKIHIVQSKAKQALEDFNRIHVIKGKVGYPGKVRGKVQKIYHPDSVQIITPGKIIITSMTSTRMLPFIRHAIAIVTDVGGTLSHAAIVARELKIPCVVGTRVAMRVLENGDLVEVDASEGVIRKL